MDSEKTRTILKPRLILEDRYLVQNPVEERKVEISRLDNQDSSIISIVQREPTSLPVHMLYSKSEDPEYQRVHLLTTNFPGTRGAYSFAISPKATDLEEAQRFFVGIHATNFPNSWVIDLFRDHSTRIPRTSLKQVTLDEAQEFYLGLLQRLKPVYIVS